MDFSLPPGLSRGASPSDRPGRWYDSNLVRSSNGRLVPVGGWARVTGQPLATMVRRIHAAVDNTGIKRVVLGMTDRLALFEGGAVTDISPANLVPLQDMATLSGGYGQGAYGAGTYGTPRQTSVLATRGNYWSLDSYGELVVALASSDGRVVMWDPTAPTVAAAPLPNAPINCRGMVVTDERSVMVMGADGDHRRIAWSSREDYSDWNYTDPTNSAGFIDLETPGQLNAIAKCRDGLLVWSDNGDVFLGRNVGANYYYGFERIAVGAGLLSATSYAVVGGAVYWMGTHGFWRYEGGSVSPVACEMSDAFTSLSVYAPIRAHASYNSAHPEVWFHCPVGEGQAECNRYYSLDIVSGAWYRGELSRTAMHPAGIFAGPLMTCTDRHLYEHENGTTAAGAPRTGKVWIESNIVSSDGQVAIMRAQMDSGVANGSTSLTIYGSQTREGAEVTYGPYLAGPNGWMPTRAGGRHLRVRLTQIGDSVEWSIGHVLLDAAPVGSR